MNFILLEINGQNFYFWRSYKSKNKPMSFKLYTLQLFGKLKSADDIENRREKLRKDFEEFQKVSESEELQKYLDLEKLTNSEEFRKNKAEIEKLELKGSREFNQLNELSRLEKSSAIKKYFKLVDSNELKRFENLKNSSKIDDYDRLLEYIKEGQFEKEKSEIKGQRFKGSVEEKHWLDFKRFDKSPEIKAYKELNGSQLLKKHEAFTESEKLKGYVKLRNAPERDKTKAKALKELQRDPEIKNYFKLEKSKKLKLYKETVNSHDLKKYHELKSYVEKDEFKKRETFLKDKKKFEKSEAYKKYSDFKKLQSDPDVRFVLKFEKSKLYKNYLDVTDSFDLKRLNELRGITQSDEFKTRKAYLEDKKKWEKTEEFKQEQELAKMKTLPHFINYFKYQGSTKFDFFNNWELSFEDNFKSGLDKEKWSNVAFVAQKTLGENYSMPGDLHVFANGSNVKVANKLTISVKKEKRKGMVWQMPAGFVPVEFDYTSDMVSTNKSFWQEDGIFEAKIKFNPHKQVVSSLYLCGENNTPRINLLEMGTKNNVGVSSVNASGKISNKGFDISKLKKGASYIFTVTKSGNSLKWSINETEIFETQDASMNFPLHLNASSMVVYEVSNLPIDFEIEWIKCYCKK